MGQFRLIGLPDGAQENYAPSRRACLQPELVETTANSCCALFDLEPQTGGRLLVRQRQMSTRPSERRIAEIRRDYEADQNSDSRAAIRDVLIAYDVKCAEAERLRKALILLRKHGELMLRGMSGVSKDINEALHAEGRIVHTATEQALAAAEPENDK